MENLMLITSLFVERVGVSYLLLIKRVKLFPHEIKKHLVCVYFKQAEEDSI